MAKRKLTSDPNRRRELLGEVSKMMRYVQHNGGDTTLFDGNELSDSLASKTMKLPHAYLKSNPELAKRYPELFNQSATGTQVYTDDIAELRGQRTVTSAEPSIATVKPVNNIIPRGGDSYTKEAIRSFFGAKDAYAYNVRTPSGEAWQPAKSPSDAFDKLKQSSPSLEMGNKLFEKVKKKLGTM